jgi:hypothetical protein
VTDEALVRFLPGRSQSDAPVALAVVWPEPQYRAVIARWPGLAALLGSTWDECRVRTQRYCVLADGHGLPRSVSIWPPKAWRSPQSAILPPTRTCARSLRRR